MERTHNQRENLQRREVSKRVRTGRTNLPPITVMAKIPKRRIIRVSRATREIRWIMNRKWRRLMK